MALSKVILVLGLPRSGSSCIAGMLQCLGVPMGAKFQPADERNPKGYFEDRGLLRIRSQTSPPAWHSRPLDSPYDLRVFEKMRRWRERRSADGRIIGGKLPFLGCMVPEINQAFSAEWKAVVPERPILESAMSAQAAGPHWRNHSLPEVVEIFETARRTQESHLAKIGTPTLRIAFHALMSDPFMVVEQLISFCGLDPTWEQIDAAVAWVDPQLNHFSPEVEQYLLPLTADEFLGGESLQPFAS